MRDVIIKRVKFSRERPKLVGCLECLKPAFGKRRRPEARAGNCPGDRSDGVGVAAPVDGAHDGGFGGVSRQRVIQRGLERVEDEPGVLQLVRDDAVGNRFKCFVDPS